MTTVQSKDELKNLIYQKLMSNFGRTIEEANREQVFKACALIIRDILIEERSQFKKEVQSQDKKMVYYLSMEFLIGRLLVNNMINMGIKEIFQEALQDIGYDLSLIEDIEPDPALGNGGLGRLAACYLDSMASVGLAGMGFSIRYEYGIFKQKIINDEQVELADEWLGIGDVWQLPKEDETLVVRFGGQIIEHYRNERLYFEHKNATSILALPYDVSIAGWRSDSVDTLRLWSASSAERFDTIRFNKGDYVRSQEEHMMAEAINKVLYPDDQHMEGKELRLKQQYFFVSATVQSVLKRHRKEHPISKLPDMAAVHINDTHPALAIPELMRLLLDVEMLEWDEAWDITLRTMSYTNHTIMSEALEKWPQEMFAALLPRIYMIVKEINERYCQSLLEFYPGDFEKIRSMAIVADGQIRMANLCVVGSHRVNGVSELHSDIIKTSLFKDFYKIWPQKFCNVTNGITHRRWLIKANPGLSSLISDTIGDDWKVDLDKIKEIAPFAEDVAFRQRFRDVKIENKKKLSDYILKTTGIAVNASSIFDVQAKRLHEYKRQQLNILHILHIYHTLLQNPSMNMPPRTFIFAAKAAPGYYMAKQTIKLICKLSNRINSDSRTNEKIKIVFLEDYRATLAELIIPAADVSEQISVAGTEASGTGNMKFMLSGAVTIGTLDGANVEIHRQVGDRNIYLFGLGVDEVEAMKERYLPGEIYENNQKVKQAMDLMLSLVDDDCAKEVFYHLVHHDPYMVLADFDSYASAHSRLAMDYLNEEKWLKMAIENTAFSGIFSSDRSIREYAQKIWHCTLS